MKINVRGISLIEVLITILVIGIGLLGLAGLQSVSMKNTYQASQRSQAMWLAQEIAERMRANPAGKEAGFYSTTGTTNKFGARTPNNSTKCGTKPTKMCSAYSNNGAGFATTAAATDCSAEEMASYDAWELMCGQSYTEKTVNSSVIDTLPELTATITCADADTGDTLPCSAGSDININLRWFSTQRLGTDADAPVQDDNNVNLKVRL
ncbi:type IV pilus modification protein PilV [Zooshikella marina]|uniref:type IV pilus modification protein PilV n=1 Tax=Zooshikella ganghwensis TaxID=202772 RepID=UPI000407C27A|nr:type IV pilus modification protein PilV [Zooshikella ganghwensis]MBU2707412.1 type IV pilus modification protein PilV [Zooshikella ganghwensis]